LTVGGFTSGFFFGNLISEVAALGDSALASVSWGSFTAGAFTGGFTTGFFGEGLEEDME
jgi:hypothetical protein